MRKVSRRGLLRSSMVMAAGACALRPGLLAFSGVAGDAAQSAPKLGFPTAPRDRIAVAFWPVRAEIESTANEYRDRQRPGMDLRDFAVKVPELFGVRGVEPLSTHFPSTDASYLHEVREAMEQAGVHV